MTDPRHARLDRLTDRWRTRHEARLASEERPRADAEREAKADAFFPWRTQTPGEYAATYGAAMIGYTYDAYSYSDPLLEKWLRELGVALGAQRRRC